MKASRAGRARGSINASDILLLASVNLIRLGLVVVDPIKAVLPN